MFVKRKDRNVTARPPCPSGRAVVLTDNVVYFYNKLIRSEMNNPAFSFLLLMMIMKIYTKTGDAGETSLLGGKRVAKNCLEMQVIGELDELNASLGVVVTQFELQKPAQEICMFIQMIQRDLFKIGAELAALQSPLQDMVEKIDTTRVLQMEKYIDMFWQTLPELKNFILPGGGLVGAEIHRARTVCRRAERQLVDFSKKISLRPELQMYLNRLSDFLFATARKVNHQDGVEEIVV